MLRKNTVFYFVIIDEMSNRRGTLDMLLAANDEKQRNEIARRTKLLYTPLDLPSYDDRAMNDKFTIKKTMNAETSLLQHKRITADNIIVSHHGKKKSSQSSKPPSLQPMRRNKHPLKLREKSIPEKNQDNSNSSYATRNYSKEKTKDACCVETSSPVRNQPLLHTIKSATKNSSLNDEPMYKVLAVSSSSYSSKSRVQQQNETSQPATLLDSKQQFGYFKSLESGRTVVVLASNSHADNSNIICGPALTDSPTAKSAQMIVQVEPREQVKVVLSRHADNDDDRNSNEITAPRMMMNAPMSMALTSTAFPTRGSNKLHNNVNILDESEKKMTFAGDSRIVNQQPQQSAMMSIDNCMITNNDKKVQQPKTLLTCLSSSSCTTRTNPYEQKLVEEGSFEYNLQSLTNELSDIRHIFELIQSHKI